MTALISPQLPLTSFPIVLRARLDSCPPPPLHEPLVLLRGGGRCGGGEVGAYRPHLAREQMGRTMVISVDCVMRMYPDIGPAG